MAINFKRVDLRGAKPSSTLTYLSVKPGWPSRGSKGVVAGIDKAEIERVIKNVRKLADVMAYNAAMATADSLIAVLSESQPRVPVDTGELRRSGVAVVETTRTYEVARGNDDGTVTADITGIAPTSMKGKYKSINGYITYKRVSKSGMDIALWTHENLLPYTERGKTKSVYKQGVKTPYSNPTARTPGTGPKYLELAFLQLRDRIAAMLRDAVVRTPSDLKERRITTVGLLATKQRKYIVDSVDLIHKQIRGRGYYGFR